MSIHSCSYYCDRPECIKAQRDELRERLAQPEQEPVAIALNTGTKQGVKWLKNVEHGERLYTTPPQRKPLTDEEIYMNCPNWLSQEQCKTWVRQIEAAHGIKENT